MVVLWLDLQADLAFEVEEVVVLLAHEVDGADGAHRVDLIDMRHIAHWQCLQSVRGPVVDHVIGVDGQLFGHLPTLVIRRYSLESHYITP